LAKALEGEDVALTKTGEIMGSPAYMAPERLSGSNTDARSDICSLGIMLYEMLTFKNPYLDPRSMPQTTMNVVEANPILPRKLVPWLPVEIEAITLKAMQKEPDNRYQSMEEFGSDIRRYQRGDPVLANPPTLWSKGKRLIHVHWSVFLIGLMIIAFTSLYVLTFYYHNKKEQPYWKLIYQCSRDAQADWSAGTESENYGNGKWVYKDKSLYSPGAGRSFIRLRPEFSHDIRVEFDIKTRSDDFSNAGFFLDGISPDSGYCFQIHKGPRGQCGISYPGSDFLFADYNPVELLTSDRYHASIEKKDNAYVFKLNDLTIAKIWDFYPPTGKNHRQAGFFANGSPFEISNFKIFGYVVPRPSALETPADRIAQRGEDAIAYEEYRELFPERSSDAAVRDISLKMTECLIRLGNFEKASTLLEKIPHSDDPDDPLAAKRLYLMGILFSSMGKKTEANGYFVQLFKLAPESPLSASAANLMLLWSVNHLKNSDPVSAQDILRDVVDNFQKPSKNSGKTYLMIMDYYLAKGQLDKAKEAADIVMTAYKNEPDVLLTARVLLSKAYLAKGDKAMATDLLNQCVASYMPSEAAWQAWMELAEIYEYDANWTDAFTIYRKIFDDCPKYLFFPWMARVKMGEIADRVTSEEKPASIFKEVIASPHPFALPRLLARFYLDSCSKEDFKKSWVLVNPGNRDYLNYYAKKALMESRPELARWYLKEFKRDLPPNIWPAQLASKAISLLEK
jgi:tetratricopeptide (TPR) repeat protein